MVPQITITLTGLTCSACKKVVEKRLQKIEGVQTVVVDLGTGQATIDASRDVSTQEMQHALEDTLYKVVA